MYEERTYRKAKNENRFRYFQAMIGESDLWIGTTLPQDDTIKENIMRMIRHYRNEITQYAKHNKGFFDALYPIGFESSAPEIVREMCAAVKPAGVGPMASVAGIIAERIGKYIERICPDQEILIENGGDIWVKFFTTLTIRLDAGTSPFSKKVGISLTSELSPCGICTSSGTVGHSMSFGKADAVAVICGDAAVADAWATALCNKIQTTNDLTIISEHAGSETDILGCVAVVNDQIAAIGEIALVSFQ